MSHDLLVRLHHRLVEAVRRASPEAVDRPLTIADVYQHLVPYRSVRGELGFGELQEYEHTLLRLFAGEADLVRLEVAQVAEEFERELRSSNPILGIYRDYAAVGLSLNAAAAKGVAEAPPTPKPTAEPVSSAPEARPAPPPPEPGSVIPRAATVAMPPAPAPSTAPPPPSAPAAPGASQSAPADSDPDRSSTEELPIRSAAAGPCWHCDEALPTGREVRYCPHCGTVQVPTPCEECGAAIEPAWRFCVLCGSPRAPLPMMTSP